MWESKRRCVSALLLALATLTAQARIVRIAVTSDLQGAIAGVPETYLIDGHGIVRWRFVGPIPPRVASEGIPALMKKFGS